MKAADLPISTESEEQQALFEWAAVQRGKYPVLRKMYHIPNGGKRSISEAVRFKAEGVKPGIPDVHLPTARGGYHSLYIEMKRTKRGKLSPEQEECIADLREEGNCVVVCKGWAEAAKVILEYLMLEG